MGNPLPEREMKLDLSEDRLMILLARNFICRGAAHASAGGFDRRAEVARKAEDARKADEARRLEEARRAEEQQRIARLPKRWCPTWAEESIANTSDEMVRTQGHWPGMLTATRAQINLIEMHCDLQHAETKTLLAQTLSTHGIASIMVGNRPLGCQALLRSRRLHVENGNNNDARNVGAAITKAQC
jgi:hypothetical protein